MRKKTSQVRRSLPRRCVFASLGACFTRSIRTHEYNGFLLLNFICFSGLVQRIAFGRGWRAKVMITRKQLRCVTVLRRGTAMQMEPFSRGGPLLRRKRVLGANGLCVYGIRTCANFRGNRNKFAGFSGGFLAK